MTSRRVNIRDVYESLPKDSGRLGQRVRKRIDQGSPINLYAARALPKRNFVLEIGPVKKAHLPSNFTRPHVKGLAIHVEPQTNVACSNVTLLLELQQPNAVDVFVTFVARVCEELDGLEKPVDAVRQALAVVYRWKSFFANSEELLTSGRQTGLYGEVFLISCLHKLNVPLDKLVKAWTGSQRSDQDFEFGTVSIEVKSTAAVDATTVRITNIRQLDDTGVEALFLTRVVLDVRQGHSHTLPALVNQLKTEIQNTAPEVALEFEEKLLLANYKDEHAEYYENKTYAERALHFYEVKAGFPRLLESDLPTGVIEANYDLTLEACKPFKLSITEVLAKIRGLL